MLFHDSYHFSFRITPWAHCQNTSLAWTPRRSRKKTGSWKITKGELKPTFTLRRRKPSCFISAVRVTGHTYPSRKRRFSITLFKSEEFLNAGLAFKSEQKTFSQRSFWKTKTSRWSWDLPVLSLPNWKSKTTGLLAAFPYFPGAVRTWSYFQIE